MDTMTTEDVKRTIDEVCAAILLSGGAKIYPADIEQMRFWDLLKLMYPNGVRLKVELRD